eukprot:COSAG05_NODE_105_length_18793_cov_115.346421_14_plen_136_part_00
MEKHKLCPQTSQELSARTKSIPTSPSSSCARRGSCRIITCARTCESARTARFAAIAHAVKGGSNVSIARIRVASSGIRATTQAATIVSDIATCGGASYFRRADASQPRATAVFPTFSLMFSSLHGGVNRRSGQCA